MNRDIPSYTAQTVENFRRWGRKGIIPKGTYFTNKREIAVSYYDMSYSLIIGGTYLIPEDKVFFISEFEDIKEFITLEDLPDRTVPTEEEE